MIVLTLVKELGLIPMYICLQASLSKKPCHPHLPLHNISIHRVTFNKSAYSTVHCIYFVAVMALFLLTLSVNIIIVNFHESDHL